MKSIDGSGIIVPLLTPINEDESVNFGQLAKLVEYVIAGGVDAILAMGSTGEFARFTPETRGAIVAEIVKSAGGRVPVYAGVADTGLKTVRTNITNAEKAGADAVAVTLPYYFPIRNDEEAYSFFSTIAGEARLPVMLYNIPSTCGASISLDVIDRLFDFDAVVGIKDSGGDLARLKEEIRRFGNRGKKFSIVVGAEELCYDGMKAGASGIVPSMANPFPRLLADVYAAARAGDDAALRRHSDVVDEFQLLNNYCDAWMSPNVWRKKALFHMGICGDLCTAPYVPIDAEADKRILAAIERYHRRYPDAVPVARA